MTLFATLISTTPAMAATDTELPSTEFLSAHPELLLAHSQSWGKLGLDRAAHEPHKPGEPLRIATQSYTNGLGHHANGRLVVLLGGEFAKFEAEIGLQPCGGGGSVIFRVSADGRTLLDTGIMRASDAARHVNVPVAGVQELVLEANDANDGIACDMANWANARLTRSTAVRQESAVEAVNIALSGQVVTSDANRMDGSRADRLQEFHAEDVFLETELPMNADGSYTVAPNEMGIACIGLNWFGRRPVRELRLRFTEPTQPPSPDAVKVQGWFGESAWQGNWLPLAGDLTVEGDELVMRLSPKAPKGGLLLTRKIRWLLPTEQKPLAIRELTAFTRTRWEPASVIVETEGGSGGARGQVRVFSGELLVSEGQSTLSASGWNTWELSQPLRLKLKYARPSYLKADATVLQFRLPGGGVGVGMEDLLTNGCVYLPGHGLFVRLADDKSAAPTLAEYKSRIAGRRSLLDEVRTLPDQTFAQAMAKTHRSVQDEGPVMLSLACDNTKFVVGRGGDVNFPVMANNDWFAGAGDLRAVLGDGQRDHASRRLDGGWLPIPVITFERDGVRCTERVFVTPADDDGINPARLNRPAVCVIEFTIENLRESANPARLELLFRLAGNPKPAAALVRESETRFAVRLGLMQAAVVLEENGSLAVQAADGKLTLTGTLPPQGRSRVVVFLGEEGVRARQLVDLARLRNTVESYWRAVLAPATQIETPDALLNHVIRSSQVRCLIATRNEAGGARLAPWLAAMAYGPWESEAHSIIRGMDFLGHHDFARGALDYFIHRYNTNGFLTTGYTTFGTAWHLWTLGEHFQLTADQPWLRKHAPELKRVGDWILRQMEKTRRDGLDVQARPESGLMPPGVMADWNAFAFHFMMNGYYHAALRELGAGLADIGDPGASTYTRGADELRQNILRAYRWTQAQSPALPLRDGTWIPHYPSQVHSPGKLADFFPGDDAGRSWAYDTELGAHQLVPAGVLAPDDPEVTRMLNHLEDFQFLGEGWFDYPAAENAKDWFNLGGFAKVQPYYGRNAEVYAMRDEVKPFLRTYFNSLASLLNTEVLTLWEHFRHSGAWDKTHETGYFLHQTRTLLVQERGEELWLAPLIPSEWLRAGRNLSVSNAPTRFGPVSFHVTSRLPASIEVSLTPPQRAAPQSIKLRLRHPESRAIQRVTVNGREHREFESQSPITLPAGPGTLKVQVLYEGEGA